MLDSSGLALFSLLCSRREHPNSCGGGGAGFFGSASCGGVDSTGGGVVYRAGGVDGAFTTGGGAARSAAHFAARATHLPRAEGSATRPTSVRSLSVQPGLPAESLTLAAAAGTSYAGILRAQSPGTTAVRPSAAPVSSYRRRNVLLRRRGPSSERRTGRRPSSRPLLSWPRPETACELNRYSPATMLTTAARNTPMKSFLRINCFLARVVGIRSIFAELYQGAAFSVVTRQFA